MKRAIVHALFIVGLMGLGWWIHLSTDYPFPGPIAPEHTQAAVVGPWVWISGAAGSVSLGLCAVTCFSAARRRAPWSHLLFLLPIGIVGLSALAYDAEVGELVAGLGDTDVRESGYRSMLWWLSARGYAVQLILARGLLWGWLIYLAIAIAVACTPVPARTGFDTFRWAWPGATALSLAGLLFVYLLTHARVFERLLHARHLAPWGHFGAASKGLVEPSALALQAPLLTSLALLIVSAVMLLPLRPRNEDFSARPPLDVSRARALSGVAILGACVTLGLAFWAMASARVLLNIHTVLIASGEAKQALLGLWTLLSPFKDYSAGLPLCISLLVPAFILAGPLLLTSSRARRTLFGSALLLALPLLMFAGVRASTFGQLSTDLSPRCEEECTELDRVAAAMSFSRFQPASQLVTDRCSDSMGWVESDDLRLVRMKSDRCPEFAVQLRLLRDEVLVDSVPIVPPVEGQWFGPSCDPELLRRVHAHLHGRADDARAVAARNPTHPFKGRLLIVPDRSTPSGALDCLLGEAPAAGFTDAQIVVARPGRPFPVLARTVLLHADPALVPRDGAPVWTLHLTPDEARLTSPAGETWTATTADLLVEDARSVLSRFRGSPMLWVHRSDDLPLETDIEARVALTGPGLFVEAWSLPLGEEAVEWVQPDKPNHPAVP